MPRHYTRLTFTDSVKKVQRALGSREQNQRLEDFDWPDDRLGEREAAFIAARDSFYLASVGEDGWPYVQFRGGPPGFLKVLDDRTLGYADFRGNRQYITTGNVSRDDRVALILMDYPNRQRLKVMARAEVIDAGADRERLLTKLAVPGYPAVIERGVLFKVEAFDWNCPQHITPRYTEAEIVEFTRPATGPRA